MPIIKINHKEYITDKHYLKCTDIANMAGYNFLISLINIKYFNADEYPRSGVLNTNRSVKVQDNTSFQVYPITNYVLR